MAKLISIPVIVRELRVQARKPATYYSRAGWGLAAGAFLSIFVAYNKQIVANGSQMFAILHGSLTAMLLVMAPLTCADSISRERREGTLGLLLLTPLTPLQIISGKFFSHFFRLFYIWLMMVPFLIMPMLIGGVALQDFLISLAILLSIMITGLAAGFVASAISVSFGAALIGSLLLATTVNLITVAIVTNAPFFMLPNRGQQFGVPLFVKIFFLGPYFAFVPAQVAQAFQRIFATRHLFEMMTTGMLAISIIFLWFSMRFCAWRIARLAETSVESKRKETFRRRFLTPVVFKARFRRLMKRKLERNPFAWLEYRAPWSRAGICISLLAILFIQASVSPFLRPQFLLLCILLFAMTLKSASSFHYEKENGAFELILVTPITEAALVAGRLRAVTLYYLPLSLTLAVFTLFRFYMRDFHHPFYTVGSAVKTLSFWLSLISVPAVGLYFALRFKSFFTSLFWTFALAVLSAPFLWSCFETLIWFAAYKLVYGWALGIEEYLRDSWWPAILATILYHLILTILGRRFSTNLLKRRAFADFKSA